MPLKIWGWTCIISYSISRFDHCTNKQSHTPKTQLKIAHKNKKLSTQKFEPINQYTIKNWYKKQVMYTHNTRTLETPPRCLGDKVPELDNKSTIFSGLSTTITRILFQRHPCWEFGQYSHQFKQRTKFPWRYDCRATKVTLFDFHKYA